MFGPSSFLLSLDGGKLAESSRLDVLWPVNGSRRCLDTGNGYTFLYPASWLADQTLYRRYAARVEREAALDLPTLRRERMRQQGAAEPTAAFGPAGSTGASSSWVGEEEQQVTWLAGRQPFGQRLCTRADCCHPPALPRPALLFPACPAGEENISVVVAPIRDGFTLQKMGSPEEAATLFLQTTGGRGQPQGAGRRQAGAGEAGGGICDGLARPSQRAAVCAAALHAAAAPCVGLVFPAQWRHRGRTRRRS